MAVEVIGKDEQVFLKKTCGNCASILRFLKNDIKRETYMDYGGGTDTYLFVECPCCHEKVQVSYPG